METIEVKNPFELVTASKLTAQEAIDLWCDDKRLDRVNNKENCFINGHRGTGKSMLFRILQHDCQSLLRPTTDADFLAVYFSVRDAEFLTEELELFQSDAQKSVISESHFSLLIVKQLFVLLQGAPALVPNAHRKELIALLIACLRNAFQYCTFKIPSIDEQNFDDFLKSAIVAIETERSRIVAYIGLRLYEATPFSGPLFLFDTLLAPISDFFDDTLKKCLYILIDDGDDLTESHTIVLNSWIARRRKSAVFKVSTMFGYKTYRTRSRSAIQHPHDFALYDIATRYMSNPAEDYVDLLSAICTKRLQSAHIETSPGKTDPYEFFPEDIEQSRALEALDQKLYEEYGKIYEGRKVRDYVYRHLTSEYVKQLAQSRSPHSFMYSGFRTLAILSSGHVRDFIICAQLMFDYASRQSPTPTPNRITPAIQNRVVRDHADEVLGEIADPRQKRGLHSTNEDWEEIKRFVEGLGTLFKQKMLSDDSERRVFSFAFQDEPNEKLKRLLELAVAEGYLMKGYISRKEGTGRRTLYVLTRRLAPAFNLDVSSYSGYLSVKSDRVLDLMQHGASRAPDGASNLEQMTLFDDGSNTPDQWVFISPEEAGL